eukprot:gene24202-9799_t
MSQLNQGDARAPQPPATPPPPLAYQPGLEHSPVPTSTTVQSPEPPASQPGLSHAPVPSSTISQPPPATSVLQPGFSHPPAPTSTTLQVVPGQAPGNPVPSGPPGPSLPSSSGQTQLPKSILVMAVHTMDIESARVPLPVILLSDHVSISVWDAPSCSALQSWLDHTLTSDSGVIHSCHEEYTAQSESDSQEKTRSTLSESFSWFGQRVSQLTAGAPAGTPALGPGPATAAHPNPVSMTPQQHRAPAGAASMGFAAAAMETGADDMHCPPVHPMQTSYMTSEPPQGLVRNYDAHPAFQHPAVSAPAPAPTSQPQPQPTPSREGLSPPAPTPAPAPALSPAPQQPTPARVGMSPPTPAPAPPPTGPATAAHTNPAPMTGAPSPGDSGIRPSFTLDDDDE